jgi:FMN phosphatase YigB (HAD superfamily)
MTVVLKVVLFDIGGVILRTDNPGPRTRLARQYGLDRQGIDQLVFASEPARAAETGQSSEEAIWEHVRAELGITLDEMEFFRREFWAGDMVDLSLIELMRCLRPQWRVGLLTNSWLRDPLSLFGTRYGIPEAVIRTAVDEVVSSAQVGVQKPDRLIFDAALERFGVPAEQAIFIDDFAQNVEAARSMGFRAILFESPTQTRRDLLALLGI